MINIFNTNENAFLVQNQRNRAFKNDVDRLLEQVLHVDIVFVIMNSIYVAGTSRFVDDHSADNALATYCSFSFGFFQIGVLR